MGFSNNDRSGPGLGFLQLFFKRGYQVLVRQVLHLKLRNLYLKFLVFRLQCGHIATNFRFRIVKFRLKRFINGHDYPPNCEKLSGVEKLKKLVLLVKLLKSFPEVGRVTLRYDPDVNQYGLSTQNSSWPKDLKKLVDKHFSNLPIKYSN